MTKLTQNNTKNITKQGNLILCLLIVYFLFYGYVCYIYDEEISYQIIFLHRILFNEESWAALPIISLALIIMAVREPFFEHAMRKTFFISIFTICLGFLWYWFARSLDLSLITIFLGIQKAEGYYRLEGLLSILTIFTLFYICSFIGCVIRKEYEKHIARLQLIKLQENGDMDPWAEYSEENIDQNYQEIEKHSHQLTIPQEGI